MALADDYVTIALLASAAFFVALSVGLMVRYRRVSERISASTDLGHDLWAALEKRMNKQDERILDMMGRLEVVQSRVVAATAQTPSVLTPPQILSPAPSEEKPNVVTDQKTIVQQPKSQPESRTSQQVSKELLLDETQLTAINLLGGSPKNTRQITDALNKSREHTARIMKGLFELGLVSRNDSTKPFVYQLTDEGRRYISSVSGSQT